MASYKSDAGAILTPGNQINKLSSYNHEGVLGWPGIELFEQIGFVKVTNVAADKASFKSFSITVPSPDRRVSDRVRDDRTSLVVKASTDRPAYVYGASIAIAQDTPSGGPCRGSAPFDTAPGPSPWLRGGHPPRQSTFGTRPRVRPRPPLRWRASWRRSASASPPCARRPYPRRVARALRAALARCGRGRRIA